MLVFFRDLNGQMCCDISFKCNAILGFNVLNLLECMFTDTSIWKLTEDRDVPVIEHFIHMRVLS
jgi:hypothetical protein